MFVRPSSKTPRDTLVFDRTSGVRQVTKAAEVLLMAMALEGLKVIDLSRLAPGPFCSMLLGDMGADVLLVEAPADILSSGVTPSQAPDQTALAHNALRRNKRSIVLNLRGEAGREVFSRLVRDADIVIEGFRPGVVSRLGVDYEAVRKLNPGVVYCSISGYGQTGPYSQLVGHDINYISVAGALGLIGWPDSSPAIPLNLLADYAGGGLMAAFAILAAVVRKGQTGEGQYIDIAMSDGAMYLLASAIGAFAHSGELPGRGTTNLNGRLPQYNVYQCGDGKWLSIGSLESQFWANLCAGLGCEDLAPHQNDPELRDEISRRFGEAFKTKSRDEWFALLSQTDVCVAPIYDLDEAMHDRQNLARHMVIEVDAPGVGKVRQVGIAPKLSMTPGQVRSTAPSPGQHTDIVLAAAGYTTDEIAALRKTGVAA